MMLRYVSTWLERIAFQACSFNHSDISPFRINHLRVPGGAESDLCPGLCPNPVGVSKHFNRLRAITAGPMNPVRTARPEQTSMVAGAD
jgi:hypothetical protein